MSNLTYTLINKETPLCNIIIEGEGMLEFLQNCKARAILTPEIKKCVEEIRETPLIVPCDDKFTEKRLSQMNMIKNVQCERILGFDSKWEF